MPIIATPMSAKVPSYLHRRLPKWFRGQVALAWIPITALTGVVLLATGNGVGWWLILGSCVAVVIPPMFVGLRPKQRRARKRAIASAVACGVLVLSLTVAYGWDAAVLGLLIALNALFVRN